MNAEQQIAREWIEKLMPWGRRDFTEEEWSAYFQCAKYIQQLDDVDITGLLENIQHEFTHESDGDNTQSKLFILLRVLFDIPLSGDISIRRSFKGWENWPSANDSGEVNLAWPIAWKDNQPYLESHNEGSLGKPYALTSEYSYFKDRYRYRNVASK